MLLLFCHPLCKRKKHLFLSYLNFMLHQPTPWNVMSAITQEPAQIQKQNVRHRVISVVHWELPHMQVCYFVVHYLYCKWKMFCNGPVLKGYCFVTGGSKLTDILMKACVLAESCVEGSINFGISRNVFITKCCASNLCNTQSVPGNLLLIYPSHLDGCLQWELFRKKIKLQV